MEDNIRNGVFNEEQTANINRILARHDEYRRRMNNLQEILKGNFPKGVLVLGLGNVIPVEGSDDSLTGDATLFIEGNPALILGEFIKVMMSHEDAKGMFMHAITEFMIRDKLSRFLGKDVEIDIDDGVFEKSEIPPKKP